MKPRTTPTAVPMPPASTPITAVCHMPTTSAANMSRPKKSLPSQRPGVPGGFLVAAASG